MFGNEITPQTDATTSQVAGPRESRKKKVAKALLGTVAIIAAGWFILHDSPAPIPEADRSAVARNGEIGGAFAPIPPSPPPATPVAARPPPPPGRPTASGMPTMPTVLARPVVRPPISALQTSGGLRTAAANPTAPAPSTEGGVESISAVRGGGGGGGGSDRLDEGLGAGRDGGTVSATMLPDRHLFMTMGTPIPCILEQPINTQVPGPFRCKVRGPVYSTSGAVPLLDDGTWAFGRVAQHLERGMDRAFAEVTRLETPQGCLIKLRASLGDQLGTPGIDGEVGTHFFERFRGVAMIALLDAAGQAAAIGASNAIGADSGISFNQFQSGSKNLAQGSYGDDINIPPTLRRAQAPQVLIMAMDDIDMRPCFSLTMAR
jgi:type IV secretion system protein VirB10